MKVTIPLPPVGGLQQARAADAYRRGEYHEAIALYEKTLEETESAECWNDLGCAQVACKLYGEATISFRCAIRLDHAFGQAAVNLGALLAAQGQHVEAIRILTRTKEALDSEGQASLTPLIEHCLNASRTLTELPFSLGTRPTHILYMVTGFIQNGFTEGNAREAWTVFETLRQADGKFAGSFGSSFMSSFASIEPRASKREYDSLRQVHILPPDSVEAYVKENAADLLHVFTPLLSFPTDYGVQRQATILTVTSNDPAEMCSTEMLDQLRHLIDSGRLAIVCQASGSFASLERRGIRVAAVIPPVMEPPPQRTPAVRKFDNFVVGFATAPFHAEHWETRGIPLLIDLAAQSPETQFLLAWRGSPEQILATIHSRQLKNVTVLSGSLDMEDFYDEVDVVILPFGRTWGNHSSPLSAVEGMLRGKPVLATEFAGIADWLSQECAGVVTPPTVQGLRAGLIRLQSEHRQFSQQARLSAHERFDRAASITAYGRLYMRMLGKYKGPTLGEWESRVEAKGRQLVRGRPALSRFYSQQAVAETYTENRFSLQPYQQVEQQGRDAIQQLVSSRFGERTDLTLLDLATGTGRLLTCLSPFGTTTALDGSGAMLQVARQRNLTGVDFIEGDVFSCPVRDKFHVVTCGRLLRHLEYPDRQLLYNRFRELLRDDGVAIVEVPNRVKEYQLRDCAGWEKYEVYDAFWTLNEFRAELNENNFQLVSFVSVGANIPLQLEQPETAEPVEFLVSFEKSNESGTRRIDAR